MHSPCDGSPRPGVHPCGSLTARSPSRHDCAHRPIHRSTPPLPSLHPSDISLPLPGPAKRCAAPTAQTNAGRSNTTIRPNRGLNLLRRCLRTRNGATAWAAAAEGERRGLVRGDAPCAMGHFLPSAGCDDARCRTWFWFVVVSFCGRSGRGASRFTTILRQSGTGASCLVESRLWFVIASLVDVVKQGKPFYDHVETIDELDPFASVVWA